MDVIYREDADGKDGAQDGLAPAGQRGGQEDGHGDNDDGKVGRDVEDHVGDEVVGRRVALG